MNKHPEIALEKALLARPRGANGDRHVNAASEFLPRLEDGFGSNSRSFEAGLIHVLAGLASLAGAHARQYGSPIADDQVMGGAWLDALRGLRQSLTGERGRLDGGTLDHAILELHKAAGFEGEL